MLFKNKFLLSIFTLTSTFTFGQKEEYRVAFISDVHFHDVYGDFKGSFSGIKNSISGKNATIRTMESQMNSTRLFNENYFAFISVLDDLVSRNIKYVALPGDFSDDGQQVHIEGLKKILNDYSTRYGMEFFMTFGNHDPVSPFTVEAGKNDYLGSDGNNQPIFSKHAKFKVLPNSNPTIYTDVVKHQGYEDIITQINSYGMMPQKSYIYWETPFSTYDYSNYTFTKAQEAGKLSNRTYKTSASGSGELLSGKTFSVIDGSYLVEPVEGLWLLAIDSNVYVPKNETDDDNTNPNNYNSASNAGYNKVLTHKRHLIEWVKKVSEEAKKRDKTLVTFSHYPMIDFYNGASEEAENLFGSGKFELKRVPSQEVAKIFAESGIKYHFGGHMHFNDTGYYKEGENFLVNIQIPSIAAYIPAYKILTTNGNDSITVETVTIDSVPRFNELFEHYKKEYDTLAKNGNKNIWNKDILNSKSYKEFNEWHIKELVRLRFLPKEWPQDLVNSILALNGKDMITLASLDESFGDKPDLNIDELRKTTRWKNTTKNLKNSFKKVGVDFESFSKWNGADLITDLYRLRNADDLAKKDIGEEKLQEYKRIYEVLNSNPIENNYFNTKLLNIMSMMNKFSNDLPTIKFSVDLNSGELVDLSK